MKIDKQTGLPELPKGHYWEVRKETGYSFIRSYMRVTLRSEAGYELSTKRACTRSGHISYDDVRPRHIRRAAKNILSEVQKKTKSKQLEGIYPPKSLLK